MAVTDKNEIETLVRNEISRLAKKDCSAVDPDMHLRDELGLDSLYMLEMYAMIETIFGVMIPTDRLQYMDSINKVVDTIVEFQKKENL